METTVYRTDKEGKNYNSMNEEIIDCKYSLFCKRKTTMLQTKMCHGCWELETRIKEQPNLANFIITNYVKGRTDL